MARKIIKLAGSTYTRIRSLRNDEILQDREVVISKDTSELIIGTGDGYFKVVTNLHIGKNKSELNQVDPLVGRFFYDDKSGLLYTGSGTGWKRVGVSVDGKHGLTMDDSTGELKVKVDDKSITFDSDGNLMVKDTDYGVF